MASGNSVANFIQPEIFSPSHQKTLTKPKATKVITTTANDSLRRPGGIDDLRCSIDAIVRCRLRRRSLTPPQRYAAQWHPVCLGVSCLVVGMTDQ